MIPTSDSIVAVHGLGANPDWAWVYKIKDRHDKPVVNEQGEPKFVNWLKDPDILPAKMPQARIMTFNYLSRWHANAPVQRLALCAEQMVDAIHTIRQQEPGSEYRPLVFIGHSYGGIIIQQALIFAQGNPDYINISIATIGMISLGTPFRGSAVTPWAEMIARTGNLLGFGSSKSIIEDLRQDSVRLTDLRHHFALWLFRQSVPVYCFFEQFLTDYGKRFGLTWKEMVVDENSACLDGHQKYTLPTDHLKMNKFQGPDDPSYLQVSSKLVEIIHEESIKVAQRRYPWRVATKDIDWTHDHDLFMRDLCLTDPMDDLAGVKRAKGNRVDGTCEWILTRIEYTTWLTEPQNALLFIVGDPGIGKTMIAAFLSDELMRKAAINHRMAFAYYFCDNKDHTRRTAVGILRGLLLLLLRRRPALMKLLLPEYNQKGDKMFENFDTICRVLGSVLEDPDIGEVYLLVDALDECAKEQRDDILGYLGNVPKSDYNVKVVITSRPIVEIMEIDDVIRSFGNTSEMIRVDSGAINPDLSSFIDRAVGKLPHIFSESTKLKIRDAVTDRAGGTFLWVSLVLKDISKVRRIEIVEQKLRTLPKDLNEVYVRILQEIDKDDAEDARFILQCITAAMRPLKIQELAVARMIGRGYWNRPTAPMSDDILEYEAGWQCCGALLRVDSDTHTVNLIHQSAKDFLLDTQSQTRVETHKQYSFHLAQAHSLMFEICRTYLMSPSFDDCSILAPRESFGWWYQNRFNHLMLSYSAGAWCDHALAGQVAHPRMSNRPLWFEGWQRKRPEMLDSCLREAATRGKDEVVHWLLEFGVDVNATLDFGTAPRLYSRTPLSLAAERGHKSCLELLLARVDVNADTSDEDGNTPLLLAIGAGSVSCTELLLSRSDVDPNKSNEYSDTPLLLAAGAGDISCIGLLLSRRDVDPNKSDKDGNTPLSRAARAGNLSCTELLLSRSDIDPNKSSNYGSTPLLYAAEAGDRPHMEMLLSRRDVDPNRSNRYGDTPLIRTAEVGHESCMELLLSRRDVDPNKSDKYGDTPLLRATEVGHVSCMELLLSRSDVDPNKSEKHGKTPLHYAAGSRTKDIACYRACLEALLSRDDVLSDPSDYAGRLPIDYAADNAYYGKEILEALLLARTS